MGIKVGIVSDLHGRVPDSVKQVLVGCDQILCAGDLQGEDVYFFDLLYM